MPKLCPFFKEPCKRENCLAYQMKTQKIEKIPPPNGWGKVINGYRIAPFCEAMAIFIEEEG
uniref:Uncharacterized protein n=1 Tax=viral metagenome TaxID=1070528 RepID=A0A6H1ZV34_9ZZZZ